MELDDLLDDPNTPEQWQAYLAGLGDDDLVRAARGMNTLAYIEELEGEGYEGHEITDVLTMAAKELSVRGLPISGSEQGFCNMRALITGIGVPDFEDGVADDSKLAVTANHLERFEFVGLEGDDVG